MLISLSVFFLIPFFWMLSTSLKTEHDTVVTKDQPMVWIPPAPRFQNYADAFTYNAQWPPALSSDSKPGIASLRTKAALKSAVTNKPEAGYIPFLYYARNTLVLCWLCVVGTTISSGLVAYAFARLKFPGREVFFALTLATMMIPFPVLMVPTYSLFRWLGWIGSFRPLWVPAFFGSAFNIFLLRQFFRGIPFELSEAAKIDGASEWRTFLDVILPLAKPALAVVALFTFMATWTDFLGPLIYLMDDKTFTLSLGLQAYQSQNGGTDWNLLMAATTIVVLPVVVLFFFTQKLFIRGIALTGLKG
ncbi:MAG TPA: carbohydrate ABC transporter permease [Fimbriimonadaceae bacterium]